MNKNLMLPSGILAEEADYKDQIIEEYNSNPFIQALPTIRDKEEIVTILSQNLKISKKELEADEYVRIHMLQRIYKGVFQVLPIHINLDSASNFENIKITCALLLNKFFLEFLGFNLF